MGHQTAIEWTDHTFNPWWGCANVSPGCAHCYAHTFANRLGRNDLWHKNGPRRLFFKQWGGRTPKTGGRDLDGRTWDQYPTPAATA